MGNEISEKKSAVQRGFTGAGLPGVKRLGACLMLRRARVIYLRGSVAGKVAFVKAITCSLSDCKYEVSERPSKKPPDKPHQNKKASCV